MSNDHGTTYGHDEQGNPVPGIIGHPTMGDHVPGLASRPIPGAQAAPVDIYARAIQTRADERHAERLIRSAVPEQPWIRRAFELADIAADISTPATDD